MPQASLDFGQDLVLQTLQWNLGEVGAQAIEKLGATFEGTDIALGKQGLEQVFGQGGSLPNLLIESLLPEFVDKTIRILAFGQKQKACDATFLE